MKRLLIFCFLVPVFGTLAFAGLEERGYAILASSSEQNLNLIEVRNASGQRITIGTSNKDINNEQIDILDQIVDTVFSLQLINPAQVTVVFDGETSVILVPQSFRVGDIELADHMPSGMQFFITDQVQYDFRMLVQNLFLRISGQYFTEQQFAERLTRAIRNPTAFVQSQDPETVFLRISEVERVIDALEVRATEFARDTETRLADIQERFESELRAAENKISELNYQMSSLEQELELSQFGTTALNHRGLFGLRDTEKEVVDAIIAAKERNNGITIKEVRATLRQRGINVSRGLVEAVFAIYFNYFE